MNESELERALRDWAKADADVSEPARLRARVMAVPDVAKAQPRLGLRSLSGWLRTRPFAALGMAAAVAVLFAAVLVPGVLRDPDEEGTLGDPATSVVVAQDGSGDFGTIMDAVGAAADGDTILVRPGTYLESILIDKDITLRGDGDREDIVIRAPSDQADRWLPEEERTYAIRLQDTDAHVENLTLTGPASALIAHGGSPRIADVAVIDVGVANRGDDMDPSRFAGLTLVAGSTAEVRDSLFRRSDVAVDGSSVALEDNRLEASMIQLLDTSGGAAASMASLIRGNVFNDPWIAIWVDEGASPRIEGNEISGAETTAAWIRFAGPGTVVEGNTIRDSRTAMMVVESSVDIVENDVSGNQFGLNIAGTGATVRGNLFRDNTVGVLISSSSSGRMTSLTLEGNTVEGNVRGIAIKAGTSSRLMGNVVCDNETNLDIVDGADVTLQDNEICADVASAQVP